MVQLPILGLCRMPACLLSAFILLALHTFSEAALSQSVTGAMYAENFTYYKLSGEGWLKLELHSLQGDVDLYVSGLTQQPTFGEYELKSDSCGLDVVEVHSGMNRPVGIGLYSHPNYAQSAYRLDISVIAEQEYDEYEQLFRIYHYLNYDDAEDDKKRAEQSRRSNRRSKSDSSSDSESEDEEEEPVWWTILVTILKFILEVLVQA